MRVSQTVIDRYFKGDRSAYVRSMEDCLAKHAAQSSSKIGAEKTKADDLSSKLQKEIDDNKG